MSDASRTSRAIPRVFFQLTKCINMTMDDRMKRKPDSAAWSTSGLDDDTLSASAPSGPSCGARGPPRRCPCP